MNGKEYVLDCTLSCANLYDKCTVGKEKSSNDTMCAGDMFNYMAQKPGPLCKMFVVQTVELAKSWKN